MTTESTNVLATFRNTRSGETCLQDKELADYGTVDKGNWQSEAVKC